MLKSGAGSNFTLLERALLTLTSLSLILLVAPLGFCSRSVPPSFSQSVPAPNRSWFSLIYNVAPLWLFSHLPGKVAGVASAFPGPSHPPSDSLQGPRSTTRQYASSFSS